MSEITVNDRRLFNKDGQISEESPQESQKSNLSKEPQGPPEVQGGVQPQEDLTGQSDKADDSEARDFITAGLGNFAANFSTLIIGLATSALMQLGESSPEDEAAPTTPPDLNAAKHTIDILGVLEKKTKGNLDEAEEALLSTLLFDLRMKYVALAKASK
jgi:hypothetical protein